MPRKIVYALVVSPLVAAMAQPHHVQRLRVVVVMGIEHEAIQDFRRTPSVNNVLRLRPSSGHPMEFAEIARPRAGRLNVHRAWSAAKFALGRANQHSRADGFGDGYVSGLRVWLVRALPSLRSSGARGHSSLLSGKHGRASLSAARSERRKRCCHRCLVNPVQAHTAQRQRFGGPDSDSAAVGGDVSRPGINSRAIPTMQELPLDLSRSALLALLHSAKHTIRTATQAAA